MDTPAVTSSAVPTSERERKSRSEHRPRERPINFGTRLRVCGLVTLPTTLPSQYKLSAFVEDLSELVSSWFLGWGHD